MSEVMESNGMMDFWGFGPGESRKRGSYFDEQGSKRLRCGGEKENFGVWNPPSREASGSSEAATLRAENERLRSRIQLHRSESEAAIAFRDRELQAARRAMDEANARIAALERDNGILKRAVTIQENHKKDAQSRIQGLEHEARMARSAAENLFARNKELEKALRKLTEEKQGGQFWGWRGGDDDDPFYGPDDMVH